MPDSPIAREHPFGARLGAAALLVAGLGAAEVLLSIGLEKDASQLTRAPGLVAYGAFLYGGLALAAALLIEATRPLTSAIRRGAPAAAPLGAALLLAFACLGLSTTADWTGGSGKLTRLALLAGVAAGALVLAVWLASFAARHLPRLERVTSARRTGLLLLAVSFGASFLLRANVPSPRPLVDPPVSQAGTAGPPDVLMVVVDTLRADVLSAYGGPASTPHFDRLAANGVLFENTIAPSSWTLPSVASLLTGLYPRTHGVVDFDRSFDASLPNLPKALRSAGYHTRAVIGNTFVNPERGFDQAFDEYDLYCFEVEANLFLSGLVEELLRTFGPLRTVPRAATPILHRTGTFPWFASRIAPNVHDRDLNARMLGRAWPGDRPRFAYIQYVAPHSPYLEQPYPLAKRWTPFVEPNLERLRQLYIGEVEYMDAALGELLAGFDLEHTLVIVTSDHGESFLEHGTWEHGHDLYQEVVRIPLVIAGPGIIAGKRVEETVSLIDIAPTVLELVSLPLPEAKTGESLASTLRQAEVVPPVRGLFTEAVSRHLTRDEEWFAIVEGPWKIVQRRARSSGELVREVYNLDGDPLERDPSPEEAAIVEDLTRRLDAYLKIQVRGPDTELDADAMKDMEALGYSDSGQDE